jgi:hypothetical protein
MKNFIIKTRNDDKIIKAYYVGNLRVHRPYMENLRNGCWRISARCGHGILYSHLSLKETLAQAKKIDAAYDFSKTIDELRAIQGLKEYLIRVGDLFLKGSL